MNTLAAELAAHLAQPRLRAFLRMLRVGEGTADEDGYRRMFAGRLVDSFADHPRTPVTARLGGRPITSTAAGAYQFLSRTWDECRRALDLPDFSPASQDLAAVFLIRRRGALGDVLAGRIEQAVKRCNREWASLPGSPYGQPVRTMAQALADYARYLAQEGAGAPIAPAPAPAPQPAPETAATAPPEPPLVMPKKPWSDPLPVDPINAPQGEAMHPALIPFVAEALSTVVPKLGELFAKSDTAKRNVKALEIAANVAKDAIGARNEQEMVDTILTDEASAQRVREAIEANWFKLDEAREKSIAAAREFNAAREQLTSVRTVLGTGLTFIEFYSLLLTLGAFSGAAIVLFGDFDNELKVMVVSLVLVAGAVATREFWLGGSRLDEARKAEQS